jgi:hypothetical protein
LSSPLVTAHGSHSACTRKPYTLLTEPSTVHMACTLLTWHSAHMIMPALRRHMACTPFSLDDSCALCVVQATATRSKRVGSTAAARGTGWAASTCARAKKPTCVSASNVHVHGSRSARISTSSAHSSHCVACARYLCGAAGASGVPVTVPAFHFTFFDLDQGRRNGKYLVHESITVSTATPQSSHYKPLAVLRSPHGDPCFKQCPDSHMAVRAQCLQVLMAMQCTAPADRVALSVCARR